MPRVCILTQYFPPEMGAPQVRLSELGERLIDRGWDVEALTALPNYPTGKVFAGYLPRAYVTEHVGRIRAARVPLYTAKSGFVRRLRCYFSFVASARKHGPQLCQRPDLLYVESPPLFIGFAATSLARYWNCPFVLNVSDLWPESAIRMGIVNAGLATRVAERFELSLYRRAAGVTAQSSGIVDSIRQRVPGVRTALITNGVAPERFGRSHATDAARELIRADEGPVFIFAGLLGLAQGLDQLLDLALQLPDSVPGRIVLVGEGPAREHLARRIEKERISRVMLLPPQPREVIPQLLAMSDVAIVSLGMSLPGAVPSKIYEAMASSLPILLIGDGEPARRVQDSGCGLVVPIGDLGKAYEAFCQLASDPPLRTCLGRAGRIAAESTYHRTRIAGDLDRFLRESLISPKTASNRADEIGDSAAHAARGQGAYD